METVRMRFPQKLWYLVAAGTNAIMWGTSRRTILLDLKILEAYLQTEWSVFKTTNMSSFVRQLNLYGFRKVTSHMQDPLCNSSNPNIHEYAHDSFQCDRPDLLNNVVRKDFVLKKLRCQPRIISSCSKRLKLARKALHRALEAAILKLPVKSCYANNSFSNDEQTIEGEQINQQTETNYLPIPNVGPAGYTACHIVLDKDGNYIDENHNYLDLNGNEVIAPSEMVYQETVATSNGKTSFEEIHYDEAVAACYDQSVIQLEIIDDENLDAQSESKMMLLHNHSSEATLNEMNTVNQSWDQVTDFNPPQEGRKSEIEELFHQISKANEIL